MPSTMIRSASPVVVAGGRGRFPCIAGPAGAPKIKQPLTCADWPFDLRFRASGAWPFCPVAYGRSGVSAVIPAPYAPPVWPVQGYARGTVRLGMAPGTRRGPDRRLGISTLKPSRRHRMVSQTLLRADRKLRSDAQGVPASLDVQFRDPEWAEWALIDDRPSRDLQRIRMKAQPCGGAFIAMRGCSMLDPCHIAVQAAHRLKVNS